jgi:hypothetical protein
VTIRLKLFMHAINVALALTVRIDCEDLLWACQREVGEMMKILLVFGFARDFEFASIFSKISAASS